MTSRSKAPVFVLGSPRSGTTLLYHMLLSAGNFAIYRRESQVFNLLEPRFGKLSSPRNKRALLDAWEKTRLFTATGLSARVVESRIMAECENAGDFLRIVMEEMARRQSVERWADCTPEHLLYLKRIKETIPNALVIHIIRDGRDVALSMARQRWIRPLPWPRCGDLTAAGLYWEWIVSKGRQDGRLLDLDYSEVHFEDLVTHPEETLSRLGEFIEQDLDYEQIRRVGIGSVREPNTSFGDASEGEFSPVGRWRSEFAPTDLAIFESIVGRTLKELGYSLESVQEPSQRSSDSRRVRAVYHFYFDSKLYAKTKTPLGRFLIQRDLSWV
jgi:hypothetical protein